MMPEAKNNQPVTQTPQQPNQPEAVKKSNKKLFIILGVVVFFLFVLPGILFAIFVGYVANRGGENIVEDIAKSQGVDLDVNTKDGNVSVKDKDGNEYGTQNSSKLSDDFPKDAITLYSDKIKSNTRIKMGENISWTVSIETKDSPSVITPKIKEQLAAKAWVIQSESNSDEYNMIIAQKDPYNVVINYAAKDGVTTITYSVSQTQPTQ